MVAVQRCAKYTVTTAMERQVGVRSVTRMSTIRADPTFELRSEEDPTDIYPIFSSVIKLILT
jgi:hypothetical protein